MDGETATASLGDPMKPPTFILCCSLLTLAASCSYLSSGVTVIFRNESTETLTSVKIGYVGGECIETNLPPNSAFNVRIHPKDESSIDVSVNCGPQQFSTNLYEYIEPPYRGRVVVTFNKGHQITHASAILPWPAPPKPADTAGAPTKAPSGAEASP
jgi:hypothetical protein